jgi:amidase
MSRVTGTYTAEESGAFVELFDLEPYGPGPLDRLQFAVKDLIDVKGLKSVCGNPDWGETHPVAPANAVCVEQFLAAGARSIGKTAIDELAMGLLGENFFFGTR